MDTYSTILRRWNTAGDLRAALARHGCKASEVLIRRWWNEDMLPSRAMAALVAAAKDAGQEDVTLERLLDIASTDRSARVAHLQSVRSSSASHREAQSAA